MQGSGGERTTAEKGPWHCAHSNFVGAAMLFARPPIDRAFPAPACPQAAPGRHKWVACTKIWQGQGMRAGQEGGDDAATSPVRSR